MQLWRVSVSTTFVRAGLKGGTAGANARAREANYRLLLGLRGLPVDLSWGLARYHDSRVRVVVRVRVRVREDLTCPILRIRVRVRVRVIKLALTHPSHMVSLPPNPGLRSARPTRARS